MLYHGVLLGCYAFAHTYTNSYTCMYAYTCFMVYYIYVLSHDSGSDIHLLQNGG